MNLLMKKLFIAALIICSNLHVTFAQQMPPIPVDPNVRIGKLDNGLTYYIRKNALPEDRVDFHLAMKAGSILEEENQRGLAHFLEHMSFNGTTHFPGDRLKQYLETIGVRFGYNLNAGTSIEETTYRISDVPASRQGAVDSCLLILHDWANDLTLDPVEIDKERGVITEEWRTYRDGMERMMERALPKMYAGTKYADCLPIGNMEVVNNFKPQVLRDYYEKWYRPDLQAVIVVGDINVDDIENKIKSMFADIPAQPNAAERVYYPVPDNQEPIIVIEKDKEQPNVLLYFFNKHEAIPDEQKGNLDYLVMSYAKYAIATMLNTRLYEFMQAPNPPFIYSGAADQEYFIAKTKDAFTGVVNCKEDAIEEGFSALYREIERARRFGFTESEYLRARAEYLRYLESEYNEREKKKNDYFAQEYIKHYLENEPIPGLENEYNIMNQLAPNIPVEVINQILPTLISDHNKVISIFGADKEGLVYPTEDALLKIMKDIEAEELTAYEDKVSDEPLIAEKPVPGKVESEIHDARFGTINWTLSNGVRVIIKPTDFKADEIQMKAVSFGGTSLYPDSEIDNIMVLNSVAGLGGLGNFSQVELEKMLAGKKAWVNAAVGNRTETVTGSCSPKDFETMMELTYLRFTAPRKDMDAYNSYITRTKAALQNQELNPMTTFSDSIYGTFYGKHPRIKRMKPDLLDNIDYDKILSIYKNRYMDAGDFTFVFVGNINLEEIKPFVEEYIASLPTTGREETFMDTGIRLRTGVHKNEFIKEQETAKASIILMYSGICSYTSENMVKLSMLDQILDLVYTETVREEEGGTYGVNVGSALEKYPAEEFKFQIAFDTDPGKKDKLMELIFKGIKDLSTNGPSQLNLDKVKEHMLKSYSENLKENGYWLRVINEYLDTKVDTSANFENVVKGITIKDLKDFASELFGQNNILEVSMISPEK
ncbi:pitrilysin family protein [Bacteroides sp. 519]|uniref:M16 family metallopeptidase n=1 Tax=Bacteroides sp. 519 TaxID=2302937 RepID=UPI0013D0F1AC|nr:M16 family metallopeptidase [Bacteroides sp. 519]NDV59184.1 insulinase family protein [Bacteroides sp. 519]